MSLIYERMSITVLIIILLSLVLNANAKPITQERAQEIAQEFVLKEQTTPPKVATEIKGKFVLQNKAAGLSLGDIQPITNDSGAVLAYVQELEPQGFIITSADDDIRPVIGFSFTDNFAYDVNRSNPLLDLIKADVHARRKFAYVDYTTMGLGSSTQWGPWMQTTWRQGTHWNDKCPYRDPNNSGDRRVVGCVATALAQIVNYWEYPKSMSFSQSDSFRLSGEPASFANAAAYGFPTVSELNTALQNTLYNDNSVEEAYLCFGLGVKLHMNYGVSSSGANTYSVRNVLNNDLGFGSASAHSDRSGVWFLHSSEIIEDIKNGYPVQIAIHKSGKRGGHSIVVDGYIDDNEFFHLNYGWGANSPDSISRAWYSIPTGMRNYDVVHTVVYGIAKYQGWNQIGADERNSYHAVYPAPIDQPDRKWCVTEPTGLPITNTFSHMVVGTGGRIYSSLGPVILGDNYHPHIAIYDKFGTLENVIEATHSNMDIPYLCQNSIGEVFFPSWTGGPTATDSRIYRLNPNTDEITPIFTHSSPDLGGTEIIKVDRDNYLYFVVDAKFYCISRTGTNKWTPYTFPSSAEFHTTQPAIDVDGNRVYLNYFQKTETYKGVSRLIAFNRTTGAVVFDEVLPNIPTHYSSDMAGPPSVSGAGTVYIGAYSLRYAYSSDGTKLWDNSFSPALTSRTPAIGSDGTLYVNYGKMVSGNWRPGYVRALDPANGNTRWEMSLPLAETDYMGEIYAASNGIVISSYDKDGQSRLVAVKDNGATYEWLWDIAMGGRLAFGPGRTIYTLNADSICAWTDRGERGDPEGKGGDYTDNGQPISPTVLSPSDGSVDQDTISVQLSWNCSDPDAGQTVTYDIYVCALTEGEEAAFVPEASQVAGNSYTLPDHLVGGTQYLWSVVATDGQAVAEGPAWSFTTEGEPPVAVEDDDDIAILPEKYQLDQNYPNPFNPSTVIQFDLPRRSHVSIAIFNLLGQKVIELVDEEYPAGGHQITWDGILSNGSRASTGIYFYRIVADDFVKTKKMILLK